MANLPDVLESRVVDYVTAAVTPAALTGPILVELLSALGTVDVPGTVVAGTALAFGASGTGDVRSNAAVIRWTGLANPTTVAGYQLRDSAGAPVITVTNIPRTGGSVVVTDGIFEVAAGGLTVTAA